jgi:hemin transport system ATP-binding protein
MSLALRDVRVTVPDGASTRTILDGVDLDLDPGSTTVLTGPSGAGKSTLVAIAGLLRRPQHGEVVIAGTPTARLPERRRTALRREHVAIVYQGANLLPTLTALEQLELVGHIAKRSRSATRRRGRALLAELGLPAGAADRLPSRLSGGERQRVGIARALIAEPAVLLADEPTAALDGELAAEMSALLAAQIRTRSIAALIASHDAAPLAAADRHLHLSRGRLQAVPA